MKRVWNPSFMWFLLSGWQLELLPLAKHAHAHAHPGSTRQLVNPYLLLSKKLLFRPHHLSFARRAAWANRSIGQGGQERALVTPD